MDFFSFLLIHQLKILSGHLGSLPSSIGISFDEHPLSQTKIQDFVEHTNISIKSDTIVMFVSPTCKICHEELNKVIRKKIHKEKNMIFLGEAIQVEKFNDFRSEYKNHVNIIPLYREQLLKLGRQIYPLYMDVKDDGFITKVYRK